MNDNFKILQEKMFSAIIFGFILVAPNVLCITEEMQELANQLHDTCIAETGASNDAIENARKGNFAEDESFKCYIKCLLAQMAIIDDDGTIDAEAMVAVLPEEFQDSVAPVIRKCGSKKGANPCDNAWLTHKCYYQESPETYILI
nr:odorant binding protein 24 [Pachyrhinus yasumatsui]